MSKLAYAIIYKVLSKQDGTFGIEVGARAAVDAYIGHPDPGVCVMVHYVPHRMLQWPVLRRWTHHVGAPSSLLLLPV